MNHINNFFLFFNIQKTQSKVLVTLQNYFLNYFKIYTKIKSQLTGRIWEVNQLTIKFQGSELTDLITNNKDDEATAADDDEYWLEQLLSIY